MTARSRNEDKERCVAAGMDDYLAKPISAAETVHSRRNLGGTLHEPTWVMKVPTSESVVVMVEGELGDQSEATPCNLSVRIAPMDPTHRRHLFRPLLRGVAPVLVPAPIVLPIRTIMRGRRNTIVILVELTATKK